MKIYNIIITGVSHFSRPIRSEKLQRNIESFRYVYKANKYRLYEDRDIRRFISNNFGIRVLNAYDKIAPYAYKADLARYCLLYEYGGLYSDLSYLHLNPIENMDSAAIVAFRDVDKHPSWAASTGLIYSVPGRSEFKSAIDQVVRHAEDEFYGASWLDPTGPYLLGRILASSSDSNNIVLGQSKIISLRAKGSPEIVKLMPSGSVVAYRNKSRNSDISDLVGGPGNSYAKLWQHRQIWGERTKCYGHDDMLIKPGAGVRRATDALEFMQGFEGVRLFGPEIPLDIGSFRLDVVFVSGSVQGSFSAEIRSGNGAKVLYQLGNGERTEEGRIWRFEFDIARPFPKVQFRILSEAGFQGKLLKLEVAEI